MAEKETLVLSDKEVVPSDEFIFSLIGDKKQYWIEINNYVSGNFKEASGKWNYYNDGKQWLFKMTEKKKTLFWAGLMKETFRISFFFGDKAEPLINQSDLPDVIKEEFRSAKKYGAVRSVSIRLFSLSDADNVLKLIDIKHKLK